MRLRGKFLLLPLAAVVISSGLYRLERADAAPRVERSRPRVGAVAAGGRVGQLGPATTIPPVSADTVAGSADRVTEAAAAAQPLTDSLRDLGARQQEIVDRITNDRATNRDDGREAEALLAAIMATARQVQGPAEALLAQADVAGAQVADLAVICNCAAEMAAVAAARTAVRNAARTLRDRLATLGVATAAATLICAFFFVTPACLVALAAVAAAAIAVSFAQDDLLAETAGLRVAVAALAACMVRVRRDPACRRPSG